MMLFGLFHISIYNSAKLSKHSATHGCRVLWWHKTFSNISFNFLTCYDCHNQM